MISPSLSCSCPRLGGYLPIECMYTYMYVDACTYDYNNNCNSRIIGFQWRSNCSGYVGTHVLKVPPIFLFSTDSQTFSSRIKLSGIPKTCPRWRVIFHGYINQRILTRRKSVLELRRHSRPTESLPGFLGQVVLLASHFTMQQPLLSEWWLINSACNMSTVGTRFALDLNAWYGSDKSMAINLGTD